MQVTFADITTKTVGDLNVSLDPGPSYAFQWKALLQLDQTWFSGSTYDKQGQFPNGIIIRRFYQDIDGTLAKNWSYNFHTFIQQLFIPNNNDNNAITVILRDAFLNYGGFENANLQIGQVGIPSSLENWGFNSDLFFIDNALPVGAFFPENDFGIGIYADKTFKDTYTLAGAVYQPRQDIVYNGQIGLGKSDRLSQALRGTFSPIHTNTCVAHFGAWIRHEAMTYTFMGTAIPLPFAFQGYSDDPEALARNTGNLVDTGFIRSKSNLLSGLEIAGIYGPYMFQAEYLGSLVHEMYTNTNPAIPLNTQLWFKGWYVQGSYIFTGESHIYDFPLGLFRRPNPQNWYGAWEVVARISCVDLSDKNILGGVEHNFSIGLNWYINNVVRVCSNYVHASAHPTLSNPNGANNTRRRRLDIFAIRLQIAF